MEHLLLFQFRLDRLVVLRSVTVVAVADFSSGLPRCRFSSWGVREVICPFRGRAVGTGTWDDTVLLRDPSGVGVARIAVGIHRFESNRVAPTALGTLVMQPTNRMPLDLSLRGRHNTAFRQQHGILPRGSTYLEMGVVIIRLIHRLDC